MTTKPKASAERKTRRTLKGGAFEAIHASAVALERVGAIDKATMRQFDEMSFAKVPVFDAKRVKRMRERLRVSQPIFARQLNTSASTVQKWESGAKRPSALACKLLAVVDKHGLEVLA